MRPNARRVLIGLAIAAVAASASQAGSIWARSSRPTRELLSDNIAREVGDILHVVIAEETIIETETSRNMEKTTARSGKMSGHINFEGLAHLLHKRTFDFPNVDFSGASNTKFEGETEYDTDRSMDDQIPVIVEDVLPNGNLVVIGNRTREYGGDSQVITVSGIVRPTDIPFDNIISSKKVANFHIVHRTVGRENRFVNPGWLTRLANILNPF